MVKSLDRESLLIVKKNMSRDYNIYDDALSQKLSKERKLFIIHCWKTHIISVEKIVQVLNRFLYSTLILVGKISSI